jgi:hypothetical protein
MMLVLFEISHSIGISKDLLRYSAVISTGYSKEF